MPEKYRVQFDFTPDAYAELKSLQNEIGVATKAETFRYALRALQWITEEVKSGARILIQKNGETQAVVFPFLRVAETAKPKEVTKARQKQSLVVHHGQAR